MTHPALTNFYFVLLPKEVASMKKLLCLALVMALLTGVTVPALAADTADARLTAVTLKVKETLGLDTDVFGAFYGNFYEDTLSPVWNLNWSGDSGNLTIEADENGNIDSYYFYDKSDSTYYPQKFTPAFPKGEESAARAAADAFLTKVLDSSLESASLEPDTNKTLGNTRYNYSGTILLNGLPSPFNYYISVRAADNVILRFSRDSLYTKYIGGVPSAQPSSAADEGRALFDDVPFSLRLEYVLSDDGKTAVLRYLPESGDQYFVDAQTGELVNLTQLYQEVSDRGDYGLGSTAAANASPMDESGVKQLNGPEQEGIAKLEGVLSKETLDRKLQAIPALGLSRYTLVAAAYSVDQSAGEVTCRLQYSKETDGGLWRRYVTADAKTGTLQSVYSSTPWSEDAKPAMTVDADAAQSIAGHFLSDYYSSDYARLALYDNSDIVTISDYTASYSFHYAQKENGYFYPGNYYTVSIDTTDGSVSSFYYSFDREVTFDSTDGIISTNAALDAYLRTYAVTLDYLAVPVKLDPTVPDYIPLIKQGYSFLYSLRLAYTLKPQDGYVSGIDAKTGNAVTSPDAAVLQLTYDDMSGHWAQVQTEKLAQYRVGWLGGSFRPARQLTQFDLVCLLVSTGGYLYNPADTDENAVDYVYDIAYGMGLLTAAERSDSQIVTRGELVKLILNAGGYKEVANLTGIFRCRFQDERSIPAAYYGYAALAQGLGIVSGDGAGSFACDRAATRAEAAVMLYNLMSR